jgi:hypothetical protein
MIASALSIMALSAAVNFMCLFIVHSIKSGSTEVCQTARSYVLHEGAGQAGISFYPRCCHQTSSTGSDSKHLPATFFTSLYESRRQLKWPSLESVASCQGLATVFGKFLSEDNQYDMIFKENRPKIEKIQSSLC